MEYKTVSMAKEDWDMVKDIYAEGIKTGIATFQQDTLGWEAWDKGHCKECRLVAKIDDMIVGWAALSPVSSRCVYSGVAEVSIYIHPDYRAIGIGQQLLKALVSESEENGYWMLQASIIRENSKSISLHEGCGFRIVGYRERLGQMKDGTWHDVILVEKRAEKN